MKVIDNSSNNNNMADGLDTALLGRNKSLRQGRATREQRAILSTQKSRSRLGGIGGTIGHSSTGFGALSNKQKSIGVTLNRSKTKPKLVIAGMFLFLFVFLLLFLFFCFCVCTCVCEMEMTGRTQYL